MPYQKYKLTNNQIELFDHTLNKYNFITDSISQHLNEKNSIIDLGSAEGALTLKLHVDYNMNVTLVNPTKTEIDKTNEIIKELNLDHQKITIINKFASNIAETNKYDTVMAFAIFHHLVGQLGSCELAIKEIIRFTKKLCILEVPIGDDILLKNWQTKYGINIYTKLNDVNTFSEFLKEYFKIITIKKIDYNTNDLNRYAFLLELL